MPTWALVIVCIVSWGTWALCLKQGSRFMTPVMMQVISSYVYSAIAPIAFLYMRASGDLASWSPKGIAWVTAAVVLVTAANLSFTTAIQQAPVYLVVGFTSVYPMVTLALSAVFLGEPVTLLKLAGIVVTVIGIAMLSL